VAAALGPTSNTAPPKPIAAVRMQAEIFFMSSS
jgi:hypothetical protein